MKILFVCPYPFGLAPSQRFRFEQYFPVLEANQILHTQEPFLTENDYYILYTHGNVLKKISAVLQGFIRRFILLFRLSWYDAIFIHREATPLGPPFFEFIAAKILKKRIIYDFDDAIWLPNTSEENNFIARIKWHSKVRSIVRWATQISCGNEYLCQYSRQFNQNATVIPTTIDTHQLHNRIKDQLSEKLVIGWTGSHSTVAYLEEIVPVIAELEKQHDFRFLVISDKNPELPLQSFEFKPWNKKSEIEDLLNFNIGIMPLRNDAWSSGKCGFKALQYMALGIPAVASPVGVNTSIIDHGVNGYLPASFSQWKKHLAELLENTQLRETLGKAGREKVEAKFSTASTSEKFLILFKVQDSTPDFAATEGKNKR